MPVISFLLSLIISLSLFIFSLGHSSSFVTSFFCQFSHIDISYIPLRKWAVSLCSQKRIPAPSSSQYPTYLVIHTNPHPFLRLPLGSKLASSATAGPRTAAITAGRGPSLSFTGHGLVFSGFPVVWPAHNKLAGLAPTRGGRYGWKPHTKVGQRQRKAATAALLQPKTLVRGRSITSWFLYDPLPFFFLFVLQGLFCRPVPALGANHFASTFDSTQNLHICPVCLSKDQTVDPVNRTSCCEHRIQHDSVLL